MGKSMLSKTVTGLVVIVAAVFLIRLYVPRGGSEPIIDEASGEPLYEMVTLLPQDAIPAVDNPTFVQGDEADAQYGPDELVLGVEIDGDARAYSIPFLSGHEIVNDVVGGEPIAVTW